MHIRTVIIFIIMKLQPIYGRRISPNILAHVTKACLAVAKLQLGFTQAPSPDGRCD